MKFFKDIIEFLEWGGDWKFRVIFYIGLMLIGVMCALTGHNSDPEKAGAATSFLVVACIFPGFPGAGILGIIIPVGTFMLANRIFW
jgi:hypothetical protein